MGILMLWLKSYNLCSSFDSQMWQTASTQIDYKLWMLLIW